MTTQIDAQSAPTIDPMLMSVEEATRLVKEWQGFGIRNSALERACRTLLKQASEIEVMRAASPAAE